MTRVLLGLSMFNALMGVIASPPSNSAPGPRNDTQVTFERTSKNHDETTSVICLVRSKVRSPEVIKGQNMTYINIFRQTGA